MERLENEITSGVQFHFLKGDKFKTNVVGLLIRTNLCKENATKVALLAEVLKGGCKKYPSKQKIEIQMEELYGSIFDVSVIKKGEEQILFFYLEMIKNEKELFEKGIQFLNEVLFFPLVEDRKFSDKIVSREKESLRRKIKMKSDNKKEYAKLRCIEEMCKNEPFGIYGDGYEKDLDKINSENLYQFYLNLMKDAPIEIIVSGDSEKEAFEQLKKKFCFKRQDYKKIEYKKNAKKIGRIQEVIEKKQVLQGKLCIGYRSNSQPTGKDFYSLLVFNEILGAGASSRLFAQVREKEGLCYYINSVLYRFKSIIVVQSGIDVSEFKKVTQIIQEVIENLKTDTIEQEELEMAKKGLLKHYHSLSDYQTGIMDFYMNEYLLETKESLKDFIKNIEAVKAESINQIAKGLEQDTIYFLCPEGEEKHVSNDYEAR